MHFSSAVVNSIWKKINGKKQPYLNRNHQTDCALLISLKAGICYGFGVYGLCCETKHNKQNTFDKTVISSKPYSSN